MSQSVSNIFFFNFSYSFCQFPEIVYRLLWNYSNKCKVIGTLLKLNCKLLTELKVHLDGIIGFTAAASVEQSSFQNHSAKLSLNPYFPIANCQNIILRDEVRVFISHWMFFPGWVWLTESSQLTSWSWQITSFCNGWSPLSSSWQSFSVPGKHVNKLTVSTKMLSFIFHLLFMTNFLPNFANWPFQLFAKLFMCFTVMEWHL